MSILLGIAPDGTETRASEAVPATAYRCPDCGALMHVTHRNGVPVFARYPGQVHGEFRCQALSGQRQAEYSLLGCQNKTFFKRLLMQPGPDWRKGCGANVRPQPAPRQGRGAAAKRITSLRDIWEAGLCYSDTDVLLGNRPITETLISLHNFDYMAQRCYLGGNRIFELRPERICERGRVLEFRMTKEEGGEQKFKVFFLRYESRHEEAYNRHMELFFRRQKGEDGRLVWVPRGKRLLIGANWVDFQKDSCRMYCSCYQDCPEQCGRCLGALVARFVNDRQIFIAEEH